MVYPSGFREVEVRRGDEAYGVNLHTKKCLCRMWELSGIPCVHAVAAYMHMKMDPDLGVSEYYSQNKWFESYQYSIRPVFGSKLWKPTSNPTPLPPIERKLPGRPRKKRIKHPTENDHAISRQGRVMHCNKCWEAGHNKSSCTNTPKPKPPSVASTTRTASTPMPPPPPPPSADNPPSPPIMPHEGPRTRPPKIPTGKGKCPLTTVKDGEGRKKGGATKRGGHSDRGGCSKSGSAAKKSNSIRIGSPIRMGSTTATTLGEQVKQILTTMLSCYILLLILV